MFIRAIFLSLFLAFCSAVQAEDVKLDVNAATVEQLTGLKGIGEKKAEAIIQYREAHGKFKSIEELANVKGIGTDILEKNRLSLIVGR